LWFDIVFRLPPPPTTPPRPLRYHNHLAMTVCIRNFGVRYYMYLIRKHVMHTLNVVLIF
jgi:hypothetical protein